MNCLISTYFIYVISARNKRAQSAITLNTRQKPFLCSQHLQCLHRSQALGRTLLRNFPAGLELHPSNKLLNHLQWILPNAPEEGMEMCRRSDIPVPKIKFIQFPISYRILQTQNIPQVSVIKSTSVFFCVPCVRFSSENCRSWFPIQINACQFISRVYLAN